MKVKVLFTSAVIFFGTLLLFSCNSMDVPDETAQSRLDSPIDITFFGGPIYTVNPEQPWVEAVAIKDGVIIFAGDLTALQQTFGEAFEAGEQVDLEGAMLMPGFHDVHIHAIEAGLNERVCYFEPFLYLNEYIQAVGKCAEFQQQDRDWVLGAGINMGNLLEQYSATGWLPIDFLDEAVPDRPALIIDDLGHGAWANSLAMEAVGYDSLEGHPPGGILHRDPKTGRLSGIVFENAQQTLRNAAWAPTEKNLSLGYFALQHALEKLNRNGITSISDAGGYWTRGHHQIWQRALEEGTLTVRASNALQLFPDISFERQLAQMQSIYSDDPTSRLRFNQIKIYADGILGQGTAWLLQPYAAFIGPQEVSEVGYPFYDQEALADYAQLLDAAGFQFHVHVVGDRAARVALDIIEQSQISNGTRNRRHRLTHLYLIHPDDRPRFAELDVVADFQLAPSTIDQAYIRALDEIIGPRTKELQPAFDLYDQGATITISSDWDADALSPFVKIESILFHESENLPPLETIIEWMTINSAYLLHQEEITGSIEAGKAADLIVINQNIFEVVPGRISNTEVLMTMLAGEIVYEAP